MEWIDGVCGKTRITGFIDGEEGPYYKVVIENVVGPKNERLECYQNGSLISLPKAIIFNNFVKLNQLQLEELRELSLSLGEIDWYKEINNRITKLMKL